MITELLKLKNKITNLQKDSNSNWKIINTINRYIDEIIITNGNRLMMNFLGYNEDQFDISDKGVITIPENNKISAFVEKTISFDEDWNDLMVVVNKIEKISKTPVIIQSNCCTIYCSEKLNSENDGFIADNCSDNKLTSTYLSCLAYIIHHNKNK